MLSYPIKKGVTLFVNHFAQVKLSINGYEYEYESLSYTDDMGWYLNLNNNLMYKVDTLEMSSGLFKFITHKCGNANLKRIKDKNLREYKAYLDYINAFINDHELYNYNPRVIIAPSKQAKQSVRIILTSDTYIDTWEMYTDLRRYGLERRLKDNYFYCTLPVIFEARYEAQLNEYKI